MSNNLNKSLEILNDSKEFKEWEEKDKESFLSNCFTIVEDPKVGIVSWEVSYYNPKKDRMTSFLINEEKIIMKEDEKILKQKNLNIEEIDPKEVKYTLKQSLAKIEKRYPNEKAVKMIVILQKSDKLVWNITYITQSFNILNIKIDTNSGEILHEELKPVISYKA